jgi:heme-degrading monooxygenase HmoA
MPKLPWTSIESVPPETEVTVMGSRLPLRHYRHIPGFLAATLRIRRQLAKADGLVGYALDAELTRKTFWTVSAWTDRSHLRHFDAADPHHAATEAIRPRMEPSTFVFWTGTAADLPVAWDEVRRRIAERRSEQAAD